MQNEQISLYYSEGVSDKVYHAQIVAKDDGFVVNFQYGRRGSSLATGSKTPAPVEYAKARKIFNKLVAEKTAKGYTPDESGAAYQSSKDAGRVSGVLPMLLNAVEEADLDAYLNDPAWGMEAKADGERRLIRKVGAEVVGINRKGLVVDLMQSVVDEIAALPFEQLLIDGEDLGDAGYVAFDLLERDNVDLRNMDCITRYVNLCAALSKLPTVGKGAMVTVATLITGAASKRAAIKMLEVAGAEGVVFKRLTSLYVADRPASGGDAMKYPFYETATVAIEGHTEGKRSVAMRVYDAHGKAVSVGKVTIPADQAVPACGAICEVRYLYAFPGGALFQPVFLGLRHDQDAADCLLSKLKLKVALAVAA